MRFAWIACLGSLLFVVIGLATVLVFMVYVVVPTLEIETVMKTDCHVTDVSFVTMAADVEVRYTTNGRALYQEGSRTGGVKSTKTWRPLAKHVTNNCTSSPPGFPCELAMVEGNDYYLPVKCAYVQVEFLNTFDDAYRKGYLRNIDVLEVSRTNPSKCFCTSCRIRRDTGGKYLSLDYGESSLIIGGKRKCFYQTAREPHADSWLLLNTMFWPTIVFILGFIGTFFSCILLAKENWRWRKPVEEEQGAMIP